MLNETVEKQAEIVDEAAQALAKTANSSSLLDLAAELQAGLEKIKNRLIILETARKGAIKLTFPEDWTMFRDKAGNEVGFLGDQGCDRVNPIFGIEVFNVSIPEKIQDEDGSFCYRMIGDGRSGLTLQSVEKIIGSRGSDEDFVRGKSGSKLDTDVMKACRANLDGSITRELSGLKSVPLGEIQAILGSDPKIYARFRKGRGYGSQSERSTQGEMAPDHVEAPKCPKCKVDMVLRKGTGKNGAYAFYGCPNFKSKDCKETIQESDWIEELSAKQAPASGSNGFTKAGDVAATFAPEVVKLSGLIAQLQAADKSLTPDKICAEFFTIEGTVYKWEEVKTWKPESALKWVRKACKDIEKKYGNILPPKQPAGEPQQEGLPL